MVQWVKNFPSWFEFEILSWLFIIFLVFFNQILIIINSPFLPSLLSSPLFTLPSLSLYSSLSLFLYSSHLPLSLLFLSPSFFTLPISLFLSLFMLLLYLFMLLLFFLSLFLSSPFLYSSLYLLKKKSKKSKETSSNHSSNNETQHIKISGCIWNISIFKYISRFLIKRWGLKMLLIHRRFVFHF